MQSSTETTPTLIDDVLWERLITITGGAASPCYQCGSCTAICPWGLVQDAPISIRKVIRQAQLGIFPQSADLWLCTTCAQCETYCPRGVDIAAVIRGVRQIAWERRQTPEGLPSLLWSVYWNNNPWTQPPSHRAQWASDLKLEPFDSATHEILLYIGCTSSYDPRAGQIARALVKVLRAAGIKFGYLGEAEPCCGEAVLSVGHQPYFQDIIQHTLGVFREHSVEKLVTISPHCYDVFQNHYPRETNGIQPLHYTQFLADIVANRRLDLVDRNPLQITFQDPCYLARHNLETAAPRSVLNAIPGLKLNEMENSGEETLCCGGGGGRMWLETAAGERFADLRIQEAIETGAEILVTACPFCVACLEDSIKSQRIEGLNVLDVAEILAQAI
jgi:Fe-S oxidoreductase